MTAEDAKYVKQVMDDSKHFGLMGRTNRYARILATYHALAASQQEVETLRMQLAACGVAAMQDTEASRADRITRDSPYWTASYGDVCRQVDALIEARAQLAAAREDSARLDWLDAQRENDVEEDGYGRQVLVGCIWRIEAQSMSLRTALDTARSTDAERTHGETR